MLGVGGQHWLVGSNSVNGTGGPGRASLALRERGSAEQPQTCRAVWLRVRSAEEEHYYILCVADLTMSEIKNKDNILDAIDQLRRRKARPDADRICNFLLRRFSVSSKDTIADLERMVDAAIVIRVEYKGNISYRNAAKWSRLAGYKHRETTSENNNVTEVRKLMSRAFAALLVEDPDYLDFGIPENELKKSMMEEDPCLELVDVENILQREINSGYLVRLKNNNYSLADHPVPTWPTNGNADNSNDIHMLKFESSSSSHCEDENNSTENEQIDVSVKSVSPKAADVNNRKNTKSLEDSGTRETDSAEEPAPSAINVGGFRVGVRQKRAKKVFDPSDNNIPVRKRGRPLGSTNKTKETSQSTLKGGESAANVCSICHQQANNRRGQFENFVSCTDCVNKAHPSCLDIEEQTFPYWQCIQCKTCPRCYQTAEYDTLVNCSGCGNGWHSYCHDPEIPERSNGIKWYCCRCVASRAKNMSCVPAPVMMAVTPPAAPPPLPPGSSSPGPDPGCSAASAASVSSGDSDDTPDEGVPDASGWSIEDVAHYLEERGYPEEAAVFRVNEIDGASLLLMKRSDVLLGLRLKLGPALKLYGQVKRLQIRQSDPQLIWA